MTLQKQIITSIPLLGLLMICPELGQASGTSNIKPNEIFANDNTAKVLLKEPLSHNQWSVYAGLLYLQPSSNNLKYATFVSGQQPYYQSWHYQAIKPEFSPAFELGINYAPSSTTISGDMNWIHLNSNDKSFKQASRNTDLKTVEFVAPPFEMSPPVFGIKRVDSHVQFSFDSVLINAAKLIEYSPQLQFKFFGGINVLRLNQTLTTVFSDYAGSPATPYSYSLPPDPAFSFQLENISRYLGAGPDIGVNLQYEMNSGFGFVGQILGSLTIGTIKTQDNFTSTSSRLNTLGIGTSHQQITAPDATQVVPGTDGKLGVFYHYQRNNAFNVTIETGYRLAAYINAISTIEPNTLVQPGTVITTPEFATGTMAIVSTDSRSRPFEFSGPYINLKVAMA